MRILKFNIDGQSLEKNRDCDFSNIAAGTKGYLYADFTFRSGFTGCNKIASFRSNGEEYAVRIINGRCMIPAEVLDWYHFELYVVGVKNGYRIVTNKVKIDQQK